MSKTSGRAILVILLLVCIAGAVGWAGSHNGTTVGGVPLFLLGGLSTFALNWLTFIPAYLKQTERFFDLTGSGSCLAILALVLTFQANLGLRDCLLASMVGLWTTRLGWFLVKRIRQNHFDRRFDSLKPDFAKFLMAWTLQGFWVFLTLACALAAMTGTQNAPMDRLGWTGVAFWAAGFLIEVVADQQKRKFRSVSGNQDRFITQGLWAWSRHPNYFGEIALWFGVALLAVAELASWQLATLISPLFVFILLTRVSGVPLLESHADVKWGPEPAYQAYKERTPVLFLRPPASS